MLAFIFGGIIGAVIMGVIVIMVINKDENERDNLKNEIKKLKTELNKLKYSDMGRFEVILNKEKARKKKIAMAKEEMEKQIKEEKEKARKEGREFTKVDEGKIKSRWAEFVDRIR